MMMILRPYQAEAVDAIVRDRSAQGNNVVVLPCGAGKSLVIAESVYRLAETSLILCPTREILAQNHEKLARYVPEEDIGIYSASFGRRDVRRFTLATINSVYKQPELFAGTPLVFIDECHLVNVSNLDTMYNTFLTGIGSPKVFGLSASPYRLDTAYSYEKNSYGMYDVVSNTVIKIITRMRAKKRPAFWSNIIVNVPHQSLVDAGYLMPITYIENPLVNYEEIPVNISRSDYNLEAVSEMLVGAEANAVQVIREAETKHRSVLVFCASLDQAYRLSSAIEGSRVVAGNTPAKERATIIADFKSGKVKTVLNVGVLTTGFDFPSLDCIVLLRPTRSPVLYGQMLGRLSRIAEDKLSATLYDLSDTVRTMGAVESFEMYTGKGKWDLCTERHAKNHNRILFSLKI